jgi:uncharacterized protein (TIRG00374 family)
VSNHKKSKIRHVFLFLRIAVVLAGLGYLVYWLSHEDSRAIFSQMNLGVFALCIAIFVIGQIIIGLRWWLLLRTQAIHIPLFAAIRLYFLGWFYNNVTLGSVGGDLVRAWYVTRYTEKKIEAVLSVFVDRIIGLFSTFTIAAFCYLFFLRGQALGLKAESPAQVLSKIAEYKTIIFCITAMGIAALCLAILIPQTRQLVKKACNYFGSRLLKVLKKLKEAARLYCCRPITLLAVFILTVIVQTITITGFWLVGRTLGIETPAKYYYVFFTLTWVLGAVPVSIAGAGVVEGILAAMFIQFAAVPKDPAVALALCQRMVWLICSLPGALIHLLGAHLPKDIFIDYNKTVN